MTQLSVTTDTGISILAAQSILQHGYPVFPSGIIYYKAALPNYLLAGSIAAFGLTDFSIILPSLLMGLGSLYLVYHLGRDVLDRPWLGLAAAAFLVSLETQSYYAASPRMYMSLQFFTLLAAYSAWRGYMRGSRVFRLVTVLAVAGAILSHAQGGVLTIALPVSVLAIKWLKEGTPPSIHDLWPLSALIVLGAIYVYFVPLRNLPQPVLPVHVEFPIPQVALSGLNLDPAGWVSHINWLEHTVPLGLLLVPVLAVLGFRAIREPRGDSNLGTLYLLMLFGIWALGVLGYVRISGVRFWIGIVPVYALLLLLGINTLSKWFLASERDWTPRWFGTRALWPAGLIGWAAVVILGMSLHYGALAYPKVISAGYGIPCSDPEEPIVSFGSPPRRNSADGDCSGGVEAQYVALRPLVKENDIIISTRPFVTSYYLGRADGWLAQRKVGTSFAAFDGPIDAYYGSPLIDTRDELLELKHSPQRVWIVTEVRRRRNLSVDITALLQEFSVHGEPGPLAVYVNSAE
jgi:4-amino-4-deoxy-L-arabinose transferase-like glycosyltransferase